MVPGGSRADLFPDRDFWGRFLPAQNGAWRTRELWPTRTPGSHAWNFPGRRFRARRSLWWTLWAGLGAAGCPQVHRGRDSRENRASKAQYILPWRSCCPGRSRFAVRQRRSLDSPARRTSASFSLPCHFGEGFFLRQYRQFFGTFLLSLFQRIQNRFCGGSPNRVRAGQSG